MGIFLLYFFLSFDFFYFERGNEKMEEGAGIPDLRELCCVVERIGEKRKWGLRGFSRCGHV